MTKEQLEARRKGYERALYDAKANAAEPGISLARKAQFDLLAQLYQTEIDVCVLMLRVTINR